MSRLTPEIIALDKGIDLQTAKIIAPKGSVLDSLNYEQVDFQGQKRIDGFTRYDGHALSIADDYYVLELSDSFGEEVGEIVDTTKGMFGVVVQVDDTFIYVVPVDPLAAPAIDDSITVGGSQYDVLNIDLGRDIAEDEDEFYSNLIDFNNKLREQVGPLPGPIAGLHWFKDRLYAVASVTRTVIETSDDIHPNDILTMDSTGNATRVLDAYDPEDGIWVVWLATMNGDGTWTTQGEDVLRNDVSLGTIGDVEEYVTSVPDDDGASFFEALTESQARDDDRFDEVDAGWVFDHTGWSVPYYDGKSLYGSLPAINQNIKGLGVQGPTDSDNSGWPLALRQNVVITNKQGQVEGWKDFDTPDTFSLTPTVIGENAPLQSDVIEGETRTIYADAYIAWDAETGIVSAPGITTAALEAHPANATIPYIGPAD